MKYVQTSKEGICDAMRCKAQSVGTNADGRQVCDKHMLAPPKPKLPVKEDEKEPGAIVVRRYTDDAREALEVVDSIEINDAEELEACAEILKEVKTKFKELDALEKNVTKPLNQALRAARDTYREPKNLLSEIEKKIKRKISDYDQAQREANRLALAAAAKNVGEGDSDGARAALSAVQSTHKPQGLSYVDKYTYRITDINLLPREYLMPDYAKLKAAATRVNAGEKISISGVEFIPQTQIAVRTK